jgi:hypothetical protein
MNTTGNPLWFSSNIDDSQFQGGLNRMNRGIRNTTDLVLSSGNQLDQLAKRAAAGIGAYFSVQAFKEFAGQVVEIRSQFQQLEIAFSTMLKSKVAADTLMKELITFAGTTPFGLKESAAAAKQLLAYGSTAKNVVGELRMLGDVASGVSQPIGDLVYLYGTLKTQGRAYAMDIRQFAGRGIPIYAELAKVLKINKDQVQEFVTAGKVGFPEVEKAFANMTSAGGMFGGLMEAQSKTFNGQIERFKDAWDVVLNDMGKSQEGLFNDVISGAISALENYKQLLDMIGLLVIAYGAYRAAVIAYAVANNISTSSLLVYNVATKSVAVGQTLLAASQRTLISLQASYNAILAASPIGATVALLTTLGTVIYAVSQYTEAAEASQDRFNDIQETGAEAALKEKNSVLALVDVIKSHTATNEQRNSAYKKLQETTKGVLIGFSQEEIAAGKAKNAIDAYIKSIQEAARAKMAFSEFQKLNDQIAELDVRGTKSISTMDKVAIRFNSLGKLIALRAAGVRDGKTEGVSKAVQDEYNRVRDIATSNSQSDAAVIATQKANLQKQLTDLTKKFDTQINAELTKTGEPEATTVYGKKRSVDTIEAEITKIKEEQKSVAETSKQYQSYQKQITALEDERAKITGKQTSTQKKEISDRQKFLNELNDIEQEALRKGLTRDEEEIKAAQDKAEKLRKEARKNGLGAGVITRIDNVEKRETGDIKYRSDTEKLSATLDKQKQLYADFEQAKNDIGETAAKARYAGQLNTERSLLEELEAERAKLLGTDPTKMTGPQRERLLLLDKQINDEVKNEKDKLNTLLLLNSTYEQQKAIATDRYNAAFAKMEGSANSGRRAVLTQGYQEELNQLSEAMVRKSKVYKDAAQEALILTRQETVRQLAALNSILDSGILPADQVQRIQAEISKLKFRLNIGVDESNLGALKDEFARVAAQLHVKDENGNEIILSKEDSEAVLKRLAEIQLKIDNLINPKSGKAKSAFAQGLKANFEYLRGTTSEIAAGASEDLGQLSTGFNELSAAVGGNNTQAGYLLGTIGELAGAASDAAGAFSSFASGDIIGGITKTISAVSKVLSIGKKVKEMNAAARKEVEDFYSNAIKGEREYQDLLKERELQTIRNNKIVLQGIRDEVALRKQQNDAYVKEAAEIMAKLQGQSYVSAETYKHGTWFRKASVDKTYSSLQGMNFQQLSQLLAQGKLEGDAKALVERLKELEQKGYDAEQAIADLAKETSELFTGTTSDNLTNTLAQMFAEGKTSAKDLADFFKETMDEAALSIFKNKVLAGAMEKFYAEFDKAAQSGDELTSDEIATLNGLFTSLTGEALKKFEEFKKITGSDLTKTDSSSGSTETGASGKIVGEALTEGTANRVLGIATSQYDEIKRQGLAAKAYQTAAVGNLTSIAQNTLRTANNTDGIAEKLDTIITNTKPISPTSIEQKLKDAAIK